MKSIICAIALSPVLAFGAYAQQVETDTAHTSTEQTQGEDRLAAVLIYADWCGSCKVLDPKIASVRDQHEFDGTQFIRLDYTARDDEAFFDAADEAGIGSAIRSHLGDKVKTGQLLLVDLDDGTVVGAIKKDMSETEIADTIDSAAAEA